MKCKSVHIGSEIQTVLQEKGIAASWLAKKIHCHKTNMYKIFKKSDIDTKLLFDISLALEIDFFSLYSNQMNIHKLNRNQ